MKFMERIDDTTLISGNSLVHVGLYFTLIGYIHHNFLTLEQQLGNFSKSQCNAMVVVRRLSNAA